MKEELEKKEKAYLAENKIVLLYILKKINRSLIYNMFSDLASRVGDINFFEFNELISEMLKEQYIYNDEETNKYIITPMGEQILNLSINLIPGVRRTKINANFKKVLKELEDQRSVEAEYIKEKDGSYLINLKVLELGDEYINFRLKSYTEDEVKKILENWKNNTSEILTEILKLLNKEGNKDERK